MNQSLILKKQLSFDSNLTEPDLQAIEQLATDAGVFNAEEIRIARELAEDSLSGQDPNYKFLFLRDNSEVIIAYTCYGVIPLTDNRFDLYWIIVCPKAQGCGIGKKIMAETEKRIRQLNGQYIYAETSSTLPYAAARELYLKCGFIEGSVLKNFYRNDDDKVIYQKKL
jgi:ribosomal protein S18 acetylase RimI-like enzyme